MQAHSKQEAPRAEEQSTYVEGSRMSDLVPGGGARHHPDRKDHQEHPVTFDLDGRIIGSIAEQEDENNGQEDVHAFDRREYLHGVNGWVGALEPTSTVHRGEKIAINGKEYGTNGQKSGRS